MSSLTYPSLMNLVADLRRNGYLVTPDQCVAAEKILLGLAARGKLTPDAGVVARWLSPVFCRTMVQQNEFPTVISRWWRVRPHLVESSEGAALTNFGELESDASDSPPRRSRKMRLWTLTGVFFIGILFVLLISPIDLAPRRDSPPDDFSGGQNYDGPKESGLWIVGVLGIALAGVALVWWLDAKQRPLLRQRDLAGSPPLDPLLVERSGVGLFRGGGFRTDAHQMGRHRLVAGPELDLSATVVASAREAGAFTPVYARCPQRPEYLVLIERFRDGDQQAQLCAELVCELRDQGVWIEQFYFRGDPLQVTATGGEHSHRTLDELTALFPSHVLILLCDEHCFLNKITAELTPWVERLEAWEQRAVLVCGVEQGHASAALRERGFRVGTLRAGVLKRIVEELDSDASLRRPPPADCPRFPSLLADSSTRWIERHSPDLATVAHLGFQLRRYLGERSHLLLSACAAYPALHWQLTLHHASALFQDFDRVDVVTPLVRLPWFRHGVMPMWLRVRLISEMSPDERQRVNTVVNNLLRTTVRRVKQPFALNVVVNSPQWIGSFLLRLGLRLLPARTVALTLRISEETAIDYVTLAFTLGRKLSPGDMWLPDESRRVLQNNARSAWLPFRARYGALVWCGVWLTVPIVMGGQWLLLSVGAIAAFFAVYLLGGSEPTSRSVEQSGMFALAEWGDSYWRSRY